MTAGLDMPRVFLKRPLTTRAPGSFGIKLSGDCFSRSFRVNVTDAICSEIDAIGCETVRFVYT